VFRWKGHFGWDRSYWVHVTVTNRNFVGPTMDATLNARRKKIHSRIDLRPCRSVGLVCPARFLAISDDDDDDDDDDDYKDSGFRHGNYNC
jgi:hypothetical protein